MQRHYIAFGLTQTARWHATKKPGTLGPASVTGERMSTNDRLGVCAVRFARPSLVIVFARGLAYGARRVPVGVLDARRWTGAERPSVVGSDPCARSVRLGVIPATTG